MGQRLGQHFLNNPTVATKLTGAVAVQEGETILEIGPGKGALTRDLLKTGAHVIAIEKDEALAALLHETFKKEVGSGQFTILREDVRNFDPSSIGHYVVAANIPYYITGEIIRQFLTATRQPRAMALLIQKEVAERIIARDGKESILSLSVKAYGEPSVIAKVPKGNFSPPPSVDSAVILIQNISRDFFADLSEDQFFKVVKMGFASKRKMLAGNLSVFGKENVLRAFERIGLSPKTRAEDVSLSEWEKLTIALYTSAQ